MVKDSRKVINFLNSRSMIPLLNPKNFNKIAQFLNLRAA